jgi:CRISPR-associated endoribonuclease Cas6
MLLSQLLSLTSVTNVPTLGSLGYPAGSWFTNRLTEQQPELASRLHRQQDKPYTVSNLLDKYGNPVPKGRWLQAGEECWLRITSFSQDLSQVILKKILKILPNHLSLNKMNFRLDGHTLDPAQYPWAGENTYVDLAEQVQAYITNQKGRKANTVRLEFASPTAFRSRGADITLPIPFNVFQSYRKKWNTLAPEVLHIQEIWPDFVKKCIVVSELTAANTERWSFAEETRGAANGFTRTVGFTLLPQYLCNDFTEFWLGDACLVGDTGGWDAGD